MGVTVVGHELLFTKQWCAHPVTPDLSHYRIALECSCGATFVSMNVKDPKRSDFMALSAEGRLPYRVHVGSLPTPNRPLYPESK